MPAIIADDNISRYNSPLILSSKSLKLYQKFYEVATPDQLFSSLSEASFNSGVKENGYLESISGIGFETRLHFFKYNWHCLIFKKMLKDYLKRSQVDFDSYRMGQIGNIKLKELYNKLGLDPRSIININESDFEDYKSDLLSYYTLSTAPKKDAIIKNNLHNYHPNTVEEFEDYMNGSFIPSLNTYIESGKPLDNKFSVSLSYSQLYGRSITKR